MKRFMILLLMLVVVTLAFSQKKGKIDPKDMKIDSLTRVNTALTAQLDSVSADRDIYYSLYTVIKEKVIKYDFDPSKASELIDSLKTSRDSTIYGLTVNADSLSALKAENENLKATIASLSIAMADREKLVTELKQLKDLLDAKIITQEEFDAKKAIVMERWK